MTTPTAPVARTYDLKYAYRTMFLLSGLVIIVLYVEGMITPSLPAIAADFHVSIAEVSLVLALYAVSGTALNPVVGKLGDIYGKKKVLVYVLVAYAASVTVTGFSPTFTFMLTARAAQGIGLTILPLAFSIAREEFPREMIPRAQGILSAMFGVGFAISLPLGALISNDYGWRTTFHTAAPFVALLTILIVLRVKESQYSRPGAKVDYVGAGILGASLVSIVLAISEGPSWGWRSASTLGLILFGFVLLAPLFAYERAYQRRTGEAILTPRLLLQRNVLNSNITITAVGLAMFLGFQAYVYKFELMAPAGYGLDIFQAGLSFIPLAASMFVFAPLTGIAISRFGVRRVAILGSFIGTAGFLLSSAAADIAQLLGSMVVVGAGISIANASVINLLVLTVQGRDMGLATSLNTVFRNLGSSLGAPIAGSLLATYTASFLIGSAAGQPVYAVLPSSIAFQYAFYIAATAFVSVAIITLFAEEVVGKRAPKILIEDSVVGTTSKSREDS